MSGLTSILGLARNKQNNIPKEDMYGGRPYKESVLYRKKNVSTTIMARKKISPMKPLSL